MLSYILRRIVSTLPVMAIVALFVFSLLYIAPGDPAVVIAGDQASPEDVERIRQSLGLDRPFLIQFGSWVWRILHGDLGTSIFTNLPVSDDDRAASRTDAVADDGHASAHDRGRGAARRGGGMEGRQLHRPRHHGVRRVRLLAAGLRRRLCPRLRLRAGARMASGAGLHAAHGGRLAVAAEPDPAGGRARLRLYRADRAHHPCHHA